MADTSGHRATTRWQRLWHGCALERHQALITLSGAVCIAFGIVVAVVVPETEGPAWAMAVAGCLAAGVLLLVRVAWARFRPRRETPL
ncbi:hypothetical protein [Kitasatospora camelliae]|uniref:MYXO-CTERM domain-containing protein n=1 Tax=Kitasatospora camelliae TaxID=3156397 RepID=A0AAU8JUM4_9ACTN